MQLSTALINQLFILYATLLISISYAESFRGQRSQQSPSKKLEQLVMAIQFKRANESLHFYLEFTSITYLLYCGIVLCLQRLLYSSEVILLGLSHAKAQQ